VSSRAGAGAGCPDYLDKLLPALPDAASLLRRISVVSIAGVTCSGSHSLYHGPPRFERIQASKSSSLNGLVR